MAALPQQLQSLASGGPANAATTGTSTTPIITAFAHFNTLTGPLVPAYQFPYSVFQAGVFVTGLQQAALQAKNLPAMAAPLGKAASAAQAVVPHNVSEPVLASAGRAVPVGGLSTPPNWAAAASQPSSTHQPVALAKMEFRVLPPWAGKPDSSVQAGMPTMAQVSNAGGRRGDNIAYRMRDRRYRMPRPAPGG
jgi:hypothetical protein